MGEKSVEPLRPNDAFFVNADAGGTHQHICGVAIVDSSHREQGLITCAELKERIGRSIEDRPMRRLRQRLARPWGALTRPAWVAASDFTLDRHVRELALTPPGTQRQLDEAIEAILSEPLDRAHPLWQLWLVDGLAERRQAAVFKVHHAVADGIGLLALVQNLLDRESSPPQDRPEASRRSPPSGPRLFATTLVDRFSAPARDLLAGTRRATQNPVRAVRAGVQTARGVWELARVGRAASSPLNQPLGHERRIFLAEMPRTVVRTAARHHRATSNDVILAAVVGSIQEWLTVEGFEPPPTLRTVVPVSTRRRGSQDPGSWTATLAVDLPATAMPPRDRLREVVSATTAAKRSNQRLASQFVMHAVGLWAPPRLHDWFAHWSYRGEWFNLIVSNVPGVRRQLSLCGSPVETAFPLIPLVPGVGLTVAAMRWQDRMTFGFTADPAIIGGLDKLAERTFSLISELAAP